jgi:hypothetical protein
LLYTNCGSRNFCSTSVYLIYIPQHLRCHQQQWANTELTSRSTPYRRTEAFFLSLNCHVTEIYREQSVEEKASFVFKHTTHENLILLEYASFSLSKRFSSSDLVSGRVMLCRWVSGAWRFGFAYQKTWILRKLTSNATQPEHRPKPI